MKSLILRFVREISQRSHENAKFWEIWLRSTRDLDYFEISWDLNWELTHGSSKSVENFELVKSVLTRNFDLISIFIVSR